MTLLLLLLLLLLTEVEPGLPTRYNFTTDTGTTIDRVFINLTTYLFPITKWEIDTGCCKEMYQKHLSDHAILSMHVSFKEVCQHEAGKISEVVFRHPKFSIYHELLCHAVKLDSISDPWTRLDYHKAIISASAQYVREYIQDCKDTTPFAICMTLSTIARVVWTQSRQRALNLTEHFELAAEHLEIGDQVISIRSQGIFTEAYEKAKLDLLNKQTAKNDLKSPSPRKDKTALKLSKLSKLWVPLGKQLILEGVLVGNQIITTEPEKTIALGNAWQPTFDSKAFDYDKAQNYLNEVGDFGEYSSNDIAPDYWIYKEAIRKGPSTQPGPDALPYAAWKACGEVGIQTLIHVDTDLRNGGIPEENFNVSSMAFLVKGESDHDAVAILRDPLSTRPLCMKNTDNKIIVSANCAALSNTFKKITQDPKWVYWRSQFSQQHCCN